MFIDFIDELITYINNNKYKRIKINFLSYLSLHINNPNNKNIIKMMLPISRLKSTNKMLLTLVIEKPIQYDKIKKIKLLQKEHDLMPESIPKSIFDKLCIFYFIQINT